LFGGQHLVTAQKALDAVLMEKAPRGLDSKALANLDAFQTEFDGHGDAGSRSCPAHSAICASRFSLRVQTYWPAARRGSAVIHAPIRRDVKLHAYRTFNAQRLGTCRIAGWLRLIARGPLGAVTVGLAAAVEVLGAVRAGAVLFFKRRGRTRFRRFHITLRLFDLFLRLRFRFGFGLGLWITTGASFGGSGTPPVPAQAPVQQRAPRPAVPPEAVQDLPAPPS
jgi:hypothetical protein